MKTLLLTAMIFCSPLAHGAKKKKPAPAPSEPASVLIHVPQSELDVGSQLVEPLSRGRTELEVGVWAWQPEDFSRGSLLAGTGKFRAGPGFSFSRRASLAEFPGNGAALFWSAGASYVELERSAPLSFGRSASQSLSLLSARLLAEWQGPRFLGRVLEPYLRAGVIPTYALAAQSQLENRVSNWGFPFEAGAGILVRPRFLREFWSVHDGALGLGARYLFGSLEGSTLNGLGVEGNFSVTL